LTPALGDAVSRELDRVILYAATASEATALAEQAAARPAIGEGRARIRLGRWDAAAAEWVPEDGTPVPRRRTVLVVTLAGIVWHAVAPGVTAYQFASVLMLPGLAVLVTGAGMKLSVPARWVAALAIALLMLAGYLLEGGPEWWYWGKLAVWPLVIQLYARFGPAVRDEPWYGGHRDGAWGPP
jgi:hypothetical protein